MEHLSIPAFLTRKGGKEATLEAAEKTGVVTASARDK
jgi:hypothetical protein